MIKGANHHQRCCPDAAGALTVVRHHRNGTRSLSSFGSALSVTICSQRFQGEFNYMWAARRVCAVTHSQLHTTASPVNAAGPKRSSARVLFCKQIALLNDCVWVQGYHAEMRPLPSFPRRSSLFVTRRRLFQLISNRCLFSLPDALCFFCSAQVSQMEWLEAVAVMQNVALMNSGLPRWMS